jgi:hypothetical protein
MSTGAVRDFEAIFLICEPVILASGSATVGAIKADPDFVSGFGVPTWFFRSSRAMITLQQ